MTVMASNVKVDRAYRSYPIISCPVSPIHQNDEERSSLIDDQRNDTYQKNIKAESEPETYHSIDVSDLRSTTCDLL